MEFIVISDLKGKEKGNSRRENEQNNEIKNEIQTKLIQYHIPQWIKQLKNKSYDPYTKQSN